MIFNITKPEQMVKSETSFNFRLGGTCLGSVLSPIDCD